MVDYKEIATKMIREALDTEEPSYHEIYELLEYPPTLAMGDIAFPCFKLSKVLRKAPAVIAGELKDKIPASPYMEKVEAVSGYVNFFWQQEKMVAEVLHEIISTKDNYGAQNIGNGKTVVLDFSAPNIAKSFHIGHLRSTVIGNALANIVGFLGFKCVKVNHLGDWGTQFGKLIVAYKKWGASEKVEKESIQELMRLYVKFHEEAEKDPALEDEARIWFSKMEQGDEEALKLWEWFKQISLAQFEKIYAILEITFDSMAGESFYNDKMTPVIEELEAKHLLQESEGAMIVALDDYQMPPCLILKKDGSTLYATRDIAAVFYRKKTYDFVKCIYVTAMAQNLHFQQWFKVVDLMGYEWNNELVHVPFGLVSMEGEKLSTRKGKVVLLEELLQEAINKTKTIIEEKNPGLENKDEVARNVGVGAVIFSDLSNNRIKDIVFSWQEALNFDGETGPYIQYTHARACSILRKAAVSIEANFNSSLLLNQEAIVLVKTLYLFPEKVIHAMKEYEPSLISRYLIDLAQEFNAFYHECQVLSDDTALQNARLVLVHAVKTVLANGLCLLGLKTPEKM